MVSLDLAQVLQRTLAAAEVVVGVVLGERAPQRGPEPQLVEVSVGVVEQLEANRAQPPRVLTVDCQQRADGGQRCGAQTTGWRGVNWGV